MKALYSILLIVFCLVFGVSITNGQSNIGYIPEGRYLVVGSFYIEKNALGFTEYVKNMDKYDVKMAYHPITKYYHVYIKGYAENEKGFADVDRMRKETEFIDTWFMVVTPYDIPDSPELTASEVETMEQPVTEPFEAENKETKDEQESGWVKATINDSSPPPVEETSASENQASEAGEAQWVRASNIGSVGAPTSSPKIVPTTYKQGNKYKFFFNTYYTKNFKEIKGPVEIINPKSLKLLRVEQSLELIQIPDPNNGDHSVQLIANIFGYKKVQHDIKMEEPLDSINTEFFHFMGDTLVADFPLQRYETGDIATMYNVFFFKDAVIMKPTSKFELNSLVDMLKENDALKIKIHGHTNGKSAGKIILLPEGSDDFFKLSANVIEDKGSAKELSLQRANIIKRYLESYGINANRMEVIGWGGKKPIYDKMDKLAVKNVRVEIEILEQ